MMVHLVRFNDGRRRVFCVSEITGMEGEVVTMQDIFRFNQKGVDEDGRVLGELEATGIRPTFAEQFDRAGIAFDWPGMAAGRWG